MKRYSIKGNSSERDIVNALREREVPFLMDHKDIRVHDENAKKAEKALKANGIRFEEKEDARFF